MTLQLYCRTDLAWEAMYQDCLHARHSIEFEQYIIRDDDIGMRFLNLFLKKARQGVAVRLLFDRIGSRTIFDTPVVEAIKKSGGRVTFYNPVGWPDLFRPKSWFPRNHVKSLLIDDQVSYIGGVCLADYMSDWRDMYARMTDSSLKDANTPGRDFSYCFSRPLSSRNPIFTEFLSQIDRARESIYMATPYFLPPDQLRVALLQAVRRNVDVRVMVTEKSDIPFAVNVSRSFFPPLIKSGIRIFSYKDAVLHAKYAVIDNKWAMLGSTNIDYLSLLRNREANLFISESETVKMMKHHYLCDLPGCEELDADFLSNVPMRAKMAGYLGRSLKRII